MFGARLRIFATCSIVDTGGITNIVNRVRCARVFEMPRYSTRPRQLNLAHPEALRSGVLGQYAPFLLPVRASIVGRRLYATDNEQKPSSTHEGSKSQSILTRLLEEEQQQQPKALTVGERGVYCYGYHPVKP